MAPAASNRLLNTRDILLEIISHLDESSLHPFLLTSKACAEAVIPRLYRHLPITPHHPGIFLSPSTHSPTPDSAPAWSKRQALRHVQTLSIRTHGLTTCPGAIGPLPDLPNLQHIHLAGGEVTQSLGKICKTHSCALIDRYRLNIKRLTIRNLDQLPVFSATALTLLLRPCQFPFEPSGGAVYPSGTFRALPHARRFDLVLWDEAHDHRIDWVHHFGTAWPPFLGLPGPALRQEMEEHSGESRRFKTRGCSYCDQSGCVRYTPNMPKQLPGLVNAAVRWTGCEEVGVWNAEESVKGFQWWDSRMSVGECWGKVRGEARRGMEEREEEEDGRDWGGVAEEMGGVGAVGERSVESGDGVDGVGSDDVTGETEADEDDAVRVIFGSGREWLNTLDDEFKEQCLIEDMGYWDMTES